MHEAVAGRSVSDIDPKTGQPWELRDLGPHHNRLRDWALATGFNQISRSFWGVGVSEIPIEDLRYLTLHTIRDAHHQLDREALARIVLGRGTQEDLARPAMQPWLDESGAVFPEFAAEVRPWAEVLCRLGELDGDECERCGGSGYEPDPTVAEQMGLGYEGACSVCYGHGRKRSPDEEFP